MYAIIKTGGRQHKVSEEKTLTIEKVNKAPGEIIEFKEVLLVGASDDASIQLGNPTVEKATVFAEVLEQTRSKKISIIKFKRRKHHLKRATHRQELTKVKITKIESGLLQDSQNNCEKTTTKGE